MVFLELRRCDQHVVHVSQKVGFVLSACRKGERLATVKDGGAGECRCLGRVPRHLTINVVMPSDVCSRPEGNLPDRVTIGLNSKQFIVLTPVSRLVVCVPESLAFKSLFSELEIFFMSL